MTKWIELPNKRIVNATNIVSIQVKRFGKDLLSYSYYLEAELMNREKVFISGSHKTKDEALQTLESLKLELDLVTTDLRSPLFRY